MDDFLKLNIASNGRFLMLMALIVMVSADAPRVLLLLPVLSVACAYVSESLEETHWRYAQFITHWLCFVFALGSLAALLSV